MSPRVFFFTIALLALSLLVGLVALPSEVQALATTFTVNSSNDVDDGTCNATHCSLREAINAANANTGTDTIEFDIPGAGPHTIQPNSALPTITDPVIIDGYTQPGASPNTNPVGQGLNTVLKIELDGTNAGAGVSGLFITAGSSIVRGLVINRFGRDGIRLETNGGNVIEGNFIGTDVAGTTDLGNTFDGVEIRGGGSNNTIGGTTAGARNVISGNDFDGVLISGNGATGNLVQGNLIGTDITGTLDRGNTFDGVNIILGASNNTIGGTATGAGNVISGNNLRGVDISGVGTTGNLVEGNFIGTQVDGTSPLGNFAQGVFITSSASNNTIGGAVQGAGNVISGNDGSGVRIVGSATTGNLLQGNFIGTDVNGTADLGNSDNGVFIDGAPNNTIGGTTSGEGNVISGNNSRGVEISGTGATGNLVQGNFIGTDINGVADLGNSFDGVLIIEAPDNTVGGTTTGAGNVISGNDGIGVVISGTGAQGNRVEGNFIGTDVTGTLALGNNSVGVALVNDASHNTIGGTASGAGNTIAFNGFGGVFIIPLSIGNAVLGNSIFSNSGLGIELGLEIGIDGVTPNDAGDGDTGANNLQNFPDITSVEITASGDLVVFYNVDSTTGNSAYPILIQFFEADADGEEGKTLLGNDSYPATSAQALKGVNLGNAAGLGVSSGEFIVATATDASNNTSEFSQGIQVGVSPPVSVPSLTTWGIIAMSLLMAGLLVMGLRRRRVREA